MNSKDFAVEEMFEHTCIRYSFIQQMLYSVSSQNVLDDEEVNGIY